MWVWVCFGFWVFWNSAIGMGFVYWYLHDKLARQNQFMNNLGDAMMSERPPTPENDENDQHEGGTSNEPKTPKPISKNKAQKVPANENRMSKENLLSSVV